LIGRALSDRDFMEAVLKDPEGEIRKAGLDISPEELAQIKQVDREKAKSFAESFAQEFGDRKQQIWG